MSEDAGKIAVLKAISDETRLKIIRQLGQEEVCACHILEQLAITQPTLSHHMKILTTCGLVTARKDGIWMRYALNEQAAKQCLAFVETILQGSKDQSIGGSCNV